MIATERRIAAAVRAIEEMISDVESEIREKSDPSASEGHLAFERGQLDGLKAALAAVEKARCA